MWVNRDTITALVLLVLCAGFWAATYQVREMGFQTMGSAVWPRIIIVALAAMTLVYLVTSMRHGADGEAAEREAGLAGWFRHYANAAYCFILFFLFLVTMPYLGMLLGGVLFVFTTLTVLGDRSPRAMAVHAVISVVMIGAMWSLFTFALRVILPQGEILPLV